MWGQSCGPIPRARPCRLGGWGVGTHGRVVRRLVTEFREQHDRETSEWQDHGSLERDLEE
jgi:hypothetical protein